MPQTSQHMRHAFYVFASVTLVALVYLFDFGGIRTVTHDRNLYNNGVSKNVTLEIP